MNEKQVHIKNKNPNKRKPLLSKKGRNERLKFKNYYKIQDKQLKSNQHIPLELGIHNP